MKDGHDILASIMDERRAALLDTRALVPLETLEQAAEVRTHHSLVEALQTCETPRVVAEIKKSSPSAGLIRDPFDPCAIARDYRRAGAAGLSVLTEPLHFNGSGEILMAVRMKSELPILRKDFTCDPYHLAEAAAWGADVILLIVAALTDKELQDLYTRARDYQLDVLVEAHTDEELHRALALPEAIIGVNSRNLKTLVTDLDTARRLAEQIPADRVSIAESGIRTFSEIEDLASRGYNGFLVGESLLRQPDVYDALMALRGKAGSDGH
jgi:indole-3-glycerol phosphate synthase